ncbi:MAG: hypothetical protein QOJ29_4087 [Thermoleophilaceae bacterium]|jgi:hypothetical protein|nr:hypothetical protein [Thermoleophilaceae bacterium]
MNRARILVLMLAFALIPALPAAAAPFSSDNVELLTKLPETAGAASARFVGKNMYVSTWKGLSVFDISKPEDPQRVGFLPLPHFENEDVDAAGNVVVISNDPSEGIGLLYIIDVSNPATPMIASVMPNGITGKATVNDPLGNSSRTGHIANCLQACKYLWLTGTDQGVVVIDLRDPKNPKFVNAFQMPKPKKYGEETDPKKINPGFTHDVFVDRSGIAWVTGRDGTFGYDATDPVHPKLVYRSDENVTNSGLSGPDGDGQGPLDFLHHNSIRTDIQLAQAAPTGVADAGGVQGVAEKSPAQAAPKPKAKKRASCRRRHGESRKRAQKRCAKARKRAKAKARRSTVRAHASTTEGGLGDVVAITEEDYTRPTCAGQGSVQTWQIKPGETNSDGTTKLTMLDQWTTELNELSNQTGRSPATGNCSAHWFDEANGVLAQGWYDQGVRFMDISNPRDIRQVGYWVTAGTFWGAYYAPTDPKRQIVYGVDSVTGIDVLRFDRHGKPMGGGKTVRAPVLNRWWTTNDGFKRFLASSKWGFVCPILAQI